MAFSFIPEKSGPMGLHDRAEFSGNLHAGEAHHSLSRCHRRTRGERRQLSSTCAMPAIPVELAERYNAQGADELVFLDITASSDAREIMADLVARTARKVFIPLTVGGGIRTVADARKIILSGADKVSVNTAAVRRPELIRELSEEFGAQAVVLAIDARRARAGSWNVLHEGRPPR